MKQPRSFFLKHFNAIFNTGISLFFLLCLIISALITKYFGLIYSIIVFGVIGFILFYFTWAIFKLFLKTSSYRGKYYEGFLKQVDENNLVLKNILVKQSKNLNACAFGIFNTKCITFFSHTLEVCPEEELRGVLAHEIAHHKNHDIMKLTINIYSVFIILSFINSLILHNLSIINLLIILSLESFLALIYHLAFSRWREKKADEYAKESLKNGESLALFLERAVVEYEERRGIKVDKVPKNGEQYFNMHPWIFERIERLRELKK